MIVKIQQSLQTNGPKSVLIYDETREHMFMIDNEKLVKPLVEMLGDKTKGYYDVDITDENVIEINSEVEQQPW